MTLRIKILLCLLPILCGLLWLAWQLPPMAERMVGSLERLHALDELAAAQGEVWNGIQRAESEGQRFMVSQQPLFLAGYDEAINRLPEQLRALSIAMERAGAGGGVMPEIEALVTRRVEQLLLMVESTQVAVPGLREQMPVLLLGGRETMEQLGGVMGRLGLEIREARVLEEEQRGRWRDEMVLGLVLTGWVLPSGLIRGVRRCERLVRGYADAMAQEPSGPPRGEEWQGLERSVERLMELTEARGEVLGERLKMLQEICEGIGRPLLVVDAGWRVRWMNAAAELGLNRKREQAEGVLVWELVPEWATGGARAIWRGGGEAEASGRWLVVAPGERAMAETAGGMRQGRFAALEWRAWPEGGGLLFWERLAPESERAWWSRLEQERQVVLERERVVMAVAPDPIFVLDSRGYFLEANPAAVRLWKRSVEWLRKRAFTALVAAEEEGRIWEGLRAALQGETRRLRLRCELPGGGFLSMEWVMIGVEDGERVEVFGRDTTAEWEREQELERLRRGVREPEPVDGEGRAEGAWGTGRRMVSRALVVEDDVVQQKLAEAVLLRLGWEVRLADSGERGLALIREEDFSLVLMDLQLPDMDGWQWARQCRALEQVAGVSPVVILGMTAGMVRSDLPRCREAGMQDCLVKPVGEDALGRMLEGYRDRLPVVQQAGTPRRLGAPIDFEELLRRADGADIWVRETLGRFRRELPERMMGLSQALEKEEVERFRELLKGLSVALTDYECRSAAMMAQRLLAVEPGTLRMRGGRLLEELKGELEMIRRAIEEWMERGEPE